MALLASIALGLLLLVGATLITPSIAPGAAGKALGLRRQRI